MKYIELIVVMFLLSSFGLFLSSFIKTYKNFYDKNCEIQNETSACMFISESFKNTCDGHGFLSLNEWQKKCKSMWNLDYIAWCDAKDFLPISQEYDKKILYGKWIGKNCEGEVFWEVENEK